CRCWWPYDVPDEDDGRGLSRGAYVRGWGISQKQRSVDLLMTRGALMRAPSRRPGESEPLTPGRSHFRPRAGAVWATKRTANFRWPSTEFFFAVSLVTYKQRWCQVGTKLVPS